MRNNGTGNLLAMAVLSLLRERPMHPYEISSVMRERNISGSIKLNFGSLYSVIEGLQKKGFIEKRATEREGNHPERTVYAVTESGSIELLEQLRSLLSEPRKEYTSFAAALDFIAHLEPAEVLKLLRDRESALRGKIAEEESTYSTLVRGGLEELFLIDVDFELALKRAELDWVLKLKQKIAGEVFTAEKEGSLKWRFLEVGAGS
jgi:DNA-binding PadR family transcriptional regulator